MVIILLLCTRQSKEAPTSPPAVPLPPPMPPTMPPKYTRGKPLPPRASTEPAWLQEIHGNSLFLAKQRGSYATDMEEQEDAGEEEEGLLVLENVEEGNGSEVIFPPGIIVLLLQFKNNFFFKDAASPGSLSCSKKEILKFSADEKGFSQHKGRR